MENRSVNQAGSGGGYPFTSYLPRSASADSTDVARCPRCAFPLGNDQDAAGWTVAPFLRDSLGIVGTALGGSIGCFYSFGKVMPRAAAKLRGHVWLQVLVGVPPVILFSAGCAGVGGGALPALTQLVVSTYHVSTATSHAAVSSVTGRVERLQQESTGNCQANHLPDLESTRKALGGSSTRID